MKHDNMLLLCDQSYNGNDIQYAYAIYIDVYTFVRRVFDTIHRTLA